MYFGCFFFNAHGYKYIMIMKQGRERKKLSRDTMSLMMRVSQRTREGHHGREGPATLAVNRGIFLGTPRPVEGHRRHCPPWPSIISYPGPPPINDEETHLLRRQRATLSQLRFGHCKLLYSHKKRLKLTDSSSCPDCGIDPQDVPHLFNCTARPTDLLPVNLWDKPVKMIRELSFLDLDNLD